MNILAPTRNLFTPSRTLVVAAFATLALAFALTLTPPLTQPAGYHTFADARTLLGVPHAWNVLSNVPFLIVGVAGLRALRRGVPRGGLPELRRAYATFFAAAIAIAFGSSIYHLDPADASLAIDRLPMAVAFGALVAIVAGEHVDARLGARLLGPLVALGVASVAYWHFGGDLRPYVAVQFVPLALVPWLLWRRPSKLTGVGWLWGLLGAYALAKALELGDAALFELGVGGHALKHVVAAAGIGLLVAALYRRRPQTAPTR